MRALIILCFESFNLSLESFDLKLLCLGLAEQMLVLGYIDGCFKIPDCLLILSVFGHSLLELVTLCTRAI